LLVPKKSLGQNFLVDKNICKKISKLTNIKNKTVIEIGAGTGLLTDFLILQKPRNLILIEKDNDLFKLLSKKYKLNKNISIFNLDALEFMYEKYKSLIIISNMPYNLSTKLIILKVHYS